MVGNRKILICYLLPLLLTVSTACQGPGATPGGNSSALSRLTISKSAGPRTFNRLMSSDEQTNSITDCLMGRLIRINRQTQKPEAELAERWEMSPDGASLTCDLRKGVLFSDGRPFSADDVIFTMQVLRDPAIGSPSSDILDIDGEPVKVEKIDTHRVRFNFPAPYAGAERLLDGIPILPKHVLERPYQDGKFSESWTLASKPESIVGLGPFKLREYVPGQRVVLSKNRFFWKTDQLGRKLPLLDEIVISIDPDRNTQLLKFIQGETDLLSPVSADDIASLSELEKTGKVDLHDLGPSMIREVLWFNLNDGKQAQSGRPLVAPAKLAWFRDRRFRKAISYAIDREAIASIVFAGKATAQSGFLSQGDKLWNNSEADRYSKNQALSRKLLADAGFRYANGDRLVDPAGRAVTFTLVTNAGNALRQKMSALIQADLDSIGIKVTLAAIESRALLSTINDSFNYEACLLAIVSGDTDPSSHLNVLSSAGFSHWWNPRQKNPATEWEARIDDLMSKQSTALATAERKRLFDEVQMIMSDEQPFIFIASRHLIVAAKKEIGNLKPSLLPDFVLWNCEELYRK